MSWPQLFKTLNAHALMVSKQISEYKLVQNLNKSYCHLFRSVMELKVTKLTRHFLKWLSGQGLDVC